MVNYHLNDKGEPGVCTAKHKCRYGVDTPHYKTFDEAVAAYEEKSSANLIPEAASKEADLKIRVYDGTATEKDFRTIAVSNNVSYDLLKLVYDRTKNEATRELVESNPQYKPSSWTPEEVDEWAKNPRLAPKLVSWVNGSASDRTVSRIIDNTDSFTVIAATIMTDNQNVTDATRIKALRKGRFFAGEVYNSPNFDVDKFYSHMTTFNKLEAAVQITDYIRLSKLSTQVVSEGQAIGSFEGKFGEVDLTDVAKKIYDSPDSTVATKTYLKDNVPQIASYVRIKKVNKDVMRNIYDTAVIEHKNNDPYGDIDRLYLDKNSVAYAMEKDGLRMEDVHVLARYLWKIDVPNGKYDASTGVYSSATDEKTEV